jgi:hypothetical protein
MCIISEIILKINIVYAKKIKAEVYVYQDKSLSDLQTSINLNIISLFWIFGCYWRGAPFRA